MELCQDAIPAYEKKLEDARLALGPVTSPNGRALASLTHGVPRAVGTHVTPGTAIPDDSRVALQTDAPRLESWTDWAEDRLKETQRFMDVAEEGLLPLELRKELSHLADQLVTFHGYSQQGNRARMASTLDRVLEQGKKVRGLACTATSPTSPNRSDR